MSEQMRPVMVRMAPAMYAELIRIAEKEDRTISGVIRKAAREYIAREAKT